MSTLGDARSPAGHAAYSMRGQDDHWVIIQRQTFTNWANEQLKSVDLDIKDLDTDFCDGIRLCALMEVLQKRRIGRYVKKPINQHQYLDNVSLALKAIEHDNIKLVNIGNEDIVNGNRKLILGMVWSLILHYQIGKSGIPPKKLMLAWLQAVIPECGITNFSRDWNDGVALNALVEYCKPGLAPKWRSLRRADGLNNCRTAMNLAKEHFNIPLVLSPENLTNPDLDELSGMTYLSYFMKVDSPGYNATLNWVQSQVQYPQITNFQTDWNDGQALTALVKSLGGSIPPGGASDPSVVTETAMNVAEQQLSVLPVIPASEMTSDDVDHLGVMAYTAWFQHRSPSVPIRAPTPPPVIVPPPSPPVVVAPPRPVVPPSNMVTITPHQRETYPNNLVTFLLDIIDSDADKESVRIEVIGPSTKPDCTVNWHGGQGTGQFVPSEPGHHMIMVYNEGEVIQGCPVDINVRIDASHIHLTTPLQSSMSNHSSMIIGLDAAKVAQGAVRVEARSPSGRITDMSVVENQGVFTANFTPTEVGDWMVSIMYDNQHIQGSPFNVRVYDASQVKVFGLEGGTVGKMFGFSADCSNAGDGELTVDIKHNGRSVTATTTQESRGIYRIHFTPDGSGLYTIRVFFAGMEVSGSPYTLEIVDTSMVSAKGEGLSSVEINRKASFLVETHGASGGNIRATVTNANGSLVPCDVHNNGNGTFTVEYVPSIVGEHHIDVTYYDKPIIGSPFTVSAFDWRRITVENLSNSSMMGRMVEFDIDTSHSGRGDLEIMVNDGTIPCSVQNRGNRRFHAAFTPKESIPHYIQMRFQGKDVPGSPWTVDVRGITKVTVAGPGLDLVPIGRQTHFEARAIGSGTFAAHSLTASITGPTRKSVPVQIGNNFNGTYRLDYTPLEVGAHTIEVMYEGMPIDNSPFTSRAYHAPAISVSNIQPGIVGRQVEFNIDVTQAGEGQLEISVNNGTVPNSVKNLQKGVYMVRFVPRELRSHLIEIKFNGELLPRCPITVPIMDASRVTVQGDGIKQVAVNRQSYFHVNTKSAGDADLSVRVTAPNGEQVPAKIVQQPDGDYKVEYASKYTGRHTVEILYAGQAIMGSPFYVEIYDPKKIRVEGVTTAGVGEQVSFDIIRHEAGKADLGLTITSPSGRDVPFEITPNQHGEHVTYVAQEGGSHQIYLTYGGLEVAGSPFQQVIGDSASIEASGDGLIRAEQDKPATFFVNTGGAKGDLFVQVDGPNSIARCKIEPDRTTTGRYIVTYTPVEVGMYTVTIKWNDREVASSPFRVGVVDAAKVNVIGGWHSLVDTSNRMTLVAGHQKRMEFDVTDAGPGVLTAAVHGPYGAVQVDLQQKGNIVTVAFTPTTEGEHQVSLWWSEVALPRSPLVGIVGAGGAQRSMNGSMRSEQHVMSGQMSMDTIRVEKVILTGSGLAVAKVKEMAEFVIDGTDAGPGHPDVKLTGVKQDIDIETTPLGGNKYRCTYVPNLPGGYLLNIMWSDRQVRGSPYKVTVTDQCDASKVVCSGEGLTQGIVGKEIKSIIDTRRAGPGELTAHCMGPSLLAFCELYNHHDGTFTLNVKPQEPGRHMLEVKYGGIHVPNSPFELHVQGAPDASKVRVAGPGIDHGILARYHSRFTVETRGAGAGQLTVRIRGPKAAFRVEMQRQSQKDRTILCRYDPTEVGDYIIYVKWSGQHVPGSPFHVHIFDTEEELQNLLMSNPQGLTHPGTLGSKGSWAAEI